ncbi:MAG: WXG100 family type VII secretion target [Lachnospiraceae bacterium]|nr:WXG100 family type VII secretion target [Lachnospiraceae bacterium]
MEKMLKVTPEKLIEAASEFMNTETVIRNLTEEMISIVESFKPVWQGEAATGFANRFSSLSSDMNRLYAIIRKHSEDLTEMANEYIQAESESGSLAGSLSAAAIS